MGGVTGEDPIKQKANAEALLLLDSYLDVANIPALSDIENAFSVKILGDVTGLDGFQAKFLQLWDVVKGG